MIDMSDKPDRLNPFFRLVVVASAIFIMTIFALVAATFGGSASPASQFINAYAGTMFAVEVAVVLVLGLLALAVDRRQILRDQPSDPNPNPNPNPNPVPVSAESDDVE